MKQLYYYGGMSKQFGIRSHNIVHTIRDLNKKYKEPDLAPVCTGMAADSVDFNDNRVPSIP